MKIVVFGAARRVGALIDGKVIDLNHGLARYLREKGDAKADEQAATRCPRGFYRLSSPAPPGWKKRAV